MMTAKERVLAALRGRQPDRVPIVECIDWLPMVRLAEIIGFDAPDASEPYAFEQLSARVTRALGIDAIWVGMPLGAKPVDELHVRDRYGSLYRLSEHGEPVVVAGPVDSLGDVESLDMTSRLTDEDFAPIREMRRLLGPDYPVWFYFADTFKLSWKLRGGMAELLRDYLCNPELVHTLARATADATIATIRAAAAAGVDVLLMDGDLAATQAPLFSPPHFRTYVKPYYAEIVDAAHDEGLPIVKHSDGNMWPLMDDLIDVGFDGYNPIQPQCMAMAEAKERLGDRLCLIGNIDCMELLVAGTEDEVARTVEETIATAAPGGGFMLSSSNSIHSDVKPENYLAMVRAGLEYGTYDDALSPQLRSAR